MKKALRVAALLALLIFALAFPLLFPNPAVTTIAVFTLLYAAAGTGWNIFAGYTGYIPLGHAAFFGISAYALALMCQDWHIPGGYEPFLLMPLAGLLSAIIAIPLGWIALRTKRHTFVVITIAIFFVVQLMAYNLRSVTNGSTGLSLPIPTWSGGAFNIPFYYTGLAMMLLALALSWWIRNSKYGLGLLAIREDEERARGLGVKTEPYKLSAFVISALFAGLAGALYAYFVESIFPPFAFDPLFDITVALTVFLGGIGTLSGPILGAIILVPAQQYLALQYGENGYYLVLYGALFLLVILFLPQGIVTTLRERWTVRRRARNREIAAATSDTDREESLLAESGGTINS